MSPPDAPFEPLGGRIAFSGRALAVSVERFRYPDGEESEREVVRRDDAVAMVAYDEEHVWLVRQPREAIGVAALEIPAGKLDVPGEPVLDAARRELSEEIGKAAEQWEPITSYYASSGYSDELVHVFAATRLSQDDGAEADPGERIEIVPWPLADLDAAIDASQDAKSIIGLRWLQHRRTGGDGATH
jgi:ADP-ribose pyrophosphatase